MSTTIAPSNPAVEPASSERKVYRVKVLAHRVQTEGKTIHVLANSEKEASQIVYTMCDADDRLRDWGSEWTEDVPEFWDCFTDHFLAEIAEDATAKDELVCDPTEDGFWDN